jgi:hypothetical protein
MSTYLCKCGRTFEKNINAPVTSYRMPDYGSKHECFGCPFVRLQAVLDPWTNQISKVAECHGIKISQPDSAQEIAFGQEIINKKIKEAKRMAQEKAEPAGMAYVHGEWRYFVDQRVDDGKFTAFMSSSNPAIKDQKTEVTVIGDWDTFEEAQNALNGLALKRGFEKECSTPSEKPEMEQQTFGDNPAENSASVPPAEDTPEVEQGNDSPESGDDAADSVDGADETPDTGDDTDDSANDTENPDDAEEKDEPLPDGPDLSLRLPAFSPVFDTADDSLRDMARTLKTKYIESGELAVKIVLNNYNGVLKPDPKKCNVACNLKPAKVSTSIRFPDDLEITVEQDGRVIVPEDRDQQLSFEETKDGGTVTVDGQTGLAEHYEGDEGENPDCDDVLPESPGEMPPEGSEYMDSEGDPSVQEDRPPYIDGEDVEQGGR